MIMSSGHRRSIATAALLSAVLVSGCAGSPPPQAPQLATTSAAYSGVGNVPFAALSRGEATASGAPALRFAWPVPTEATVLEENVRPGIVSRSRYRFTAEPSSDQKSVLLHTSESSLEVVEAQPDKALEVRAVEAFLAAMNESPKPMQVSSEGAFADWKPDMERLFEVTERYLPDSPESQVFLAMLRPGGSLETQMKTAAKSWWNGAVGGWVGLDLVPGEERTLDYRSQTNGRSIPQQVTVRHVGSSTLCDGCIRLQMVIVTEGAEATAAVAEASRRMAESALQEAVKSGMTQGASGLSGTQRREAVEAMSRVDEVSKVVTVDLVTEAATLLPHRVVMETTTTVSAQGKRHAMTTKNSYHYSWL
ncbi:hypothetical protein SH611_18150 [Geminicoccaceae bacterium 1502E]|nr:hypothetical protein [Geminicoccaceae bacterium 1502E]